MPKTTAPVLMRLYDSLSWKWGWKWKIDHIDMALMYLGLDMNINILNIKHDLVWWWLYVLSNTKATLEAQFMKKLTNTEDELNKNVYINIYIYIFTLVDFLCRLKKLQSNQ